MDANAVVLEGPGRLGLHTVAIEPPGPEDVVVEIRYSGVSTGTEKLFWSGDMPPFPGMGYPLVPGYEAAGEVVEAGSQTPVRVGDMVFAPGANCYRNVVDGKLGGEALRGLFGGASSRIVTRADRVIRLDTALGPASALLALAATARHAIAGFQNALPDLIVGHGVLGRLLARMTIAAGGAPPVVWETDAARRAGAEGYEAIDPADDPRRDYRTIYDATGDARILDDLIGRLAKGGEVVLAGFYPEPLSFAFPPAFMKEARLRVAAEWNREDLLATGALVESGALSLDGLVSHVCPAADAETAYGMAFSDSACLKMILDWRASA